MTECKVKDFLATIEYLKKHGIEDIENYDLYIENPNYFAPENGISIDDAIKSIDDCQYTVSAEDTEYVVTMPDNSKRYFKTEQEAKDSIEKYKKDWADVKQSYLNTKQYFETMNKNGWHPWYDNEGWVHIEVADSMCHYTVDKENKRISLNSNY